MPDSIEKLKATIRELETELHSLQTVDEQAAEVLQEAIREIQSVLYLRQHQRSPDGDPDLPAGDSPDSLSDRLNQAAREFEGSHPTLTGILSRLIDGLGQMGI